MTAGIFALIGVLFGALTTGVSTWFFERRKERRALLVAARLVREDVVEARAALKTLLGKGWFEGPRLSVGAWESHRAVLAGEVPKDDWDAIANAITSVRIAQIGLDELLSVGKGDIKPDAIPPDGREMFLDTISALERAREVLDPVA